MKISMTLLLTILILLFINIGKADKNMNSEVSMKINEQLENADRVFKSRDYDKSRGEYLKVVEMARESGDNSLLTEACSQIARTYLITDKKEEGRDWIKKAEVIASQKEPPGWSRYLSVKGRFEWQDKDNSKAAATFKEMYDYCSDNKLHERAIDAAHMVAIVGGPDEQIEWGKKGIKEAEAGNINGWLGPLWNNLGATYEELKRYNEALEAYLKAREYHWKYGDEKNRMVADWAVGHTYQLSGEYDKAAEYLLPTLAWAEKMQDIEFIGWCHKDLGEVEIGNGNYSQGLEHLVIAEKKLKEVGMPDWWKEAYDELLTRIEEIKAKAGK
jgi:tetratricopeptide (TPR) repeat protein